MQFRFFLAALTVLYVVSAPAQNTFPASGPAGIGTTSPSSSFQIWGGDEQVTGTDFNGTAYITSRAGIAYYGNNTYSNGIAINPAGQVGIGTASPLSPLSVSGQIVIGGPYKGDASLHIMTSYGGFGRLIQEQPAGPSQDALNLASSTDNTGTSQWWAWGVSQNKWMINPGENFGVGFVIDSSGNVGVGTTTPGTKLEVNGNLRLTSGSGASMTFADGTVQSTAWTGSLCGGDYAESVDVTGGRAQYEPGDVLVIDPTHPGQFLKSNTRYSRLVAGIYSTKPGLVGRRQTTDPKLSSTEVPMAMVGIVPTKVTDENGPIEVGDLLVTSSLSAHAMKGGDGALPTGTVIGKALGSLASGTGVIEVLVSLQ